MALPVSADYPQNQIMQYQWNNFPAVPQIDAPPNLQNMIAPTAASVANEASMKAQTNPARVFTYNMLSSNFWQNQEFAEACRLTLGLLYINLRKQVYTSPEQGLPQAATQVLAMIASRFVMQYPGLVQKVDASVYQAAQMTAPILQDLIREINAMQQNMHMGHTMQMQPVIMVMTARGQMTMQEAQQFGLHYQVIGQAQMPMGGMAPMNGYPVGGPQQAYQSPGMNSGQMFNGGFGNNQASFGSSTNEFEDHRFAQAVKNFEPQQTQQAKSVFEDVPNFDVTYRQEPEQQQPVKVETTTTELLIEEGSEMDRAKHEVVYFGQSFTENLDLKIGRQAVSADLLSKSNAHDPEEESISDEFIFEPSLHVAIATGEKKRLEIRDKTKIDSMYRNFVILITPLTAAKNTAVYMEEISGAEDFSAMAKKIKSIASALQQEKEKAENQNEVEDILNVLNAIDVRMTDMINLFMAVSLGLNVTIDSFAEDIDALFSHLNKKNNLDRALREYEKEVMDVLNAIPDQSTKDKINQFYDFEPDHNGALFMENISITHMVMNSRQLGWKVKNEPLIINRATAPSLYQIAESLDKHKKELGSGTLFDYLVSTDGVVYRIYRDYITMGQFMIALA